MTLFETFYQKHNTVSCAILRLSLSLIVCFVRSACAVCLFQLGSENPHCGIYNEAIKSYIHIRDVSRGELAAME